MDLWHGMREEFRHNSSLVSCITKFGGNFGAQDIFGLRHHEHHDALFGASRTGGRQPQSLTRLELDGLIERRLSMVDRRSTEKGRSILAKDLIVRRRWLLTEEERAGLASAA